MALAAAMYISPCPAKFSRSSISFAPRFSCSQLGNRVKVRCVSSSVDPSKSTAVTEKPLISTKSGNWRWRFQGTTININYEEHREENSANEKRILMIPTISDVSTVEEWRVVAKDIVARKGNVKWRATIVDWPGLGDSERPLLNYNADVMENFLTQIVNAADSPLRNSVDEDLVIVGGGHAATIALCAAGKGQIKPSAIAAVAPTWSGPLPIVFGRSSEMESRYGLLRGTLRAPAVGWMMYNVLVSNEKAIESQYKSHVYADPDNVTPTVIKSRYALTKRKGARYVPAAFLTGLLDPVQTRDEFLDLFAKLDGKIPILVVSTKNAPKRSKAEIAALEGAKGVTKFVEVPGALLPQEEYPVTVAEELSQFLQSISVPTPDIRR
ncbi:uncharacterized protein LOC110107883 isoform X1 [Dendrobium catenatum]|uniref:AB hydrolase-1 domain-containing protein n=1 Tax=Dendrobium catenatum TaxID=906689 RepID=A0A2I0WGG0_9ASPA|nr:uncharacterized protein LOC110107883 isoform X1 [Dendrobium catenatum]PKU74738.1 hypothetical protein MA16_Dca004929 [Dendrobium catenatum]